MWKDTSKNVDFCSIFYGFRRFSGHVGAKTQTNTQKSSPEKKSEKQKLPEHLKQKPVLAWEREARNIFEASKHAQECRHDSAAFKYTQYVQRVNQESCQACWRVSLGGKCLKHVEQSKKTCPIVSQKCDQVASNWSG